jgi:hypothetical protein
MFIWNVLERRGNVWDLGNTHSKMEIFSWLQGRLERE